MNAPSCLCHFISATKTPILLWKHNEKQWVLKIADQKFLGHPRLDKRGTVYWKFKNWEEQSLSAFDKDEKIASNPESENNSGPQVAASIEKGAVTVELPNTCSDSTCPLNPCPLKENVKSNQTSTNSDHSATKE